MRYQHTTYFPNTLVDAHLPNLSESELKIILVIIRQTYGWVDKRTGQRKTRDRISHTQFMQKTGLSRRSISKSLQSLVSKGLIFISSSDGRCMKYPEERKGVSWLYYSFIPGDHVGYVARRTGLRSIGEVLVG